MNWNNENYMMSERQAAGLFLALLLDPNMTGDQKDCLVNSWNEHVKRRRKNDRA